jgi:sporulation inhibitor KapD
VERHLFIDFEFTMPEKAEKDKTHFPEIIEAGMVLVENGKILHKFRSFVKPEINPILTEKCKRFLNICQDDVDQGISFQELIKTLHSFYLPKSTVVVTWGNMDMVVLRKSCNYWNIPFPFEGREKDLSIEYMRFYGERNQTGLTKALEQYGKKEKRKHHRALEDALMTFEIFQYLQRDKQYLQQRPKNCIGDFVDLTRLKAVLA